MKGRIALSFCICLISMLLTGCEVLDSLRDEKTGDQETASIEGAREYLKTVYDKEFTDITLLEQVDEEEYERAINIDGSVTVFSKTIPAQTKTCYLAYSPDDDLYFLIFHDTVRKYYEDTLSGEQEVVKGFDEIISWAEEFFGEDFLGTDVDMYLPGNFPLYNKTEFIPVYDSPDSDVRNAFKRLIGDIENPYSLEYMRITENARHIKADPYLNIHVSSSLSELNQKGEELYDVYRGIRRALIYASDGVYNRPHLKGGGEEEMTSDIQGEEEIIIDIQE